MEILVFLCMFRTELLVPTQISKSSSLMHTHVLANLLPLIHGSAELIKIFTECAEIQKSEEQKNFIGNLRLIVRSGPLKVCNWVFADLVFLGINKNFRGRDFQF